jgi:(E)-4-hydroxy-3-methylbut-2-enyl-diphosphate synthase
LQQFGVQLKDIATSASSSTRQVNVTRHVVVSTCLTCDAHTQHYIDVMCFGCLSFLLLQLPAESDADGRRALRRLQEVGVHVLAPAAELAANPLPGAVAVMSLADALAAGGCGGFTIRKQTPWMQWCAAPETASGSCSWLVCASSWCSLGKDGCSLNFAAAAAAAGGKAPAGAARLALALNGTESDEQLAAIKSVDAVVALLDTPVSTTLLLQTVTLF